MASINKREGKTGTTYRVRIFQQKKMVESASFDRLTDAKAWAQKTEYEYKTGLKGSPSTDQPRNATMRDVIQRYESELKVMNPRRYSDVQQKLRWWDTKLGHVRLADLTKGKVLKLRLELMEEDIRPRQGRTKRTAAAVNRYLTPLVKALNVACNDWEWIKTNPLNGMKMLPEPAGRTRFLKDDDELKRLLNACKESENPLLFVIVTMAISTGGRRGELEGILMKNIDLNAERILLPTTKNKKPRLLFLAPQVIGLLRTLVTQCPANQKYLFQSPNNPDKPMDFERAWRTALRRADMTDFKFHDLRHTAASYYAAAGAGLHEIADVLGHSSLHVTKRYTHLIDRQLEQLVQKNSERIFAS